MPYGDPRGRAVFNERGTPIGLQDATGSPRACMSIPEVCGVLRTKSSRTMYWGTSLVRRHMYPARSVQGLLEHHAGAYSRTPHMSLGPPHERRGTLSWSKLCRPIAKGPNGVPRRGSAPDEQGKSPRAIRRAVGPTWALQVLASLTL